MIHRGMVLWLTTFRVTCSNLLYEMAAHLRMWVLLLALYSLLSTQMRALIANIKGTCTNCHIEAIGGDKNMNRVAW